MDIERWSYSSNSTYDFNTKSELISAINLWENDRSSAISSYGDINAWDVSKITDFSRLFDDQFNFISDISNWDVSNGSDFNGMFENAISFNQDIGSWDVSNGTDFSDMFKNAESFNQDIGSWDKVMEQIFMQCSINRCI